MVNSTQEAYERVRKHYSQPGALYGNDEMSCTYRGRQLADSQRRCSVGVLIENSEYRTEFDTACFSPLDIAHELGWTVDSEFLMEMQPVHDSCAMGGPVWIYRDSEKESETPENILFHHRGVRTEPLPMSVFIEALDVLAKKFGLQVVTDAAHTS